jgi:phage N-6-adenine-methyltransferase
MANFDVAFGSTNKDWETPDEIFIPLDKEFGFTLDVCADMDNTKCALFISKERNGLKQDWNGTCWMNPPFGDKKLWVKKAYQESQKGATVVCLLPCRTNTNWWHDYCMKGEIRFIRGRPKFKGAKHGLPQPLAIVIFRGANEEFRT